MKELQFFFFFLVSTCDLCSDLTQSQLFCFLHLPQFPINVFYHLMLWSCSLSLSRGFKVLCENAMHNAQSCLSAPLTRSISHSAHSQCCVKASALCQNHPWTQQEEKASPSPWVGRVLIIAASQLLLTAFRAAGPGPLFIHQSSPFCSWSLLTHSVVKDSDIGSEL